MCCMAMGIRQSEQASLWIATAELPKSPGHPFDTRLNALLDADDFDGFVESQCARFYAPMMGRLSLAPGRYFRLLLVGYFEGIDSERGIAWRASDSLAVRAFLRLPVDEPPPDHTTISRTRRIIDLESHRAVFTWVQQRLAAWHPIMAAARPVTSPTTTTGNFSAVTTYTTGCKVPSAVSKLNSPVRVQVSKLPLIVL
jgi:transposase